LHESFRLMKQIENWNARCGLDFGMTFRFDL